MSRVRFAGAGAASTVAVSVFSLIRQVYLYDDAALIWSRLREKQRFEPAV
jgi:hypothetical protein